MVVKIKKMCVIVIVKIICSDDFIIVNVNLLKGVVVFFFGVICLCLGGNLFKFKVE